MYLKSARTLPPAILIGLLLVDVELAGADPVTGVVVRQGDLAPITGAKVTLQALLTRTLTLPAGTFAIPVPTRSNRVVVGAAKGYFNAGVTVNSPANGVQIILPPVPQDNDPNYQFVSPDTCGVCHPNHVTQWTDSPMTRAGQNTWVHDIYNGTGTAGGMGGFGYTPDSVYSATSSNSEWASCHQPESWIPSPFTRMEGPQDPGYPSTAVVHGVSCDVCHKVANVDVTKINFPGIFPGAMGENLTVRNLNVQRLSPGTRLRLENGPLVEVTEPRKPCFVLDQIDVRLKAAVVGRCGYLARVVEPGRVFEGQCIEIAAEPESHRLSPAG